MVKKNKLTYDDININEPHYCNKCKTYIVTTDNSNFIEHLKNHGYKKLEDYIRAYPGASLFYVEKYRKQKRGEQAFNVDYKNKKQKEKKQKNKLTDTLNTIAKSTELAEFFNSLPDSELKENLLFLSNEISKWKNKYMESSEKGNPDFVLLDRIEEKNSRLLIGIERLIKIHQKDKEDSDTLLLHNNIIEECETYIKQNIGEFAFNSKCPKCGEESIVNTMGLPHFALMSEEKKIYVWSKEHYNLWKRGELSIGKMAYLLQTSPINIIETSKARGEYFISDAEHMSEEGLGKVYKELIIEAEQEVEAIRETE